MVRVSGEEARRILTRICPDLEKRELPPRRPTLSEVRHPGTGEALDRALITLFPGPDSYTGEDLVEISGHGGYLAPDLVLEACREAGARVAEAGEFTRRAYLNGKLDLIQAEAVADLVEGRSRALHRTALHHLDRGLSERISRLREALVEVEALLTHHIDFPEEDDAPVPLERVVRRGEGVLELVERLLETAPEGELLREGALTVLAGRPNSGKSSLFNAVLGQERAIVTDVPGTTRDALEAVVSLGGFPFRLVDTAGLREAEGQVERRGIEVARRYLAGADLVLLCLEEGASLGPPERRFLEEEVASVPVVVVGTKADRMDAGGEDGEEGGRWGGEQEEGRNPVARLRTSAVTGEGLGKLRKLLPELVYRGLAAGRAERPVVTRRRQAEGLRRAARELDAFLTSLREGVPAEIAATHLRPAETALEELLGVISPDDVLDRVFREFCIGK